VQLKNYYTTFFGMAQTIAAWMLYFIGTDACRSVAHISTERQSATARKLKKIPRDIAATVLLIALFFCAYLPPLRVLLLRVDKYAFFICNVPFENHWDFRIHEVLVCQTPSKTQANKRTNGQTPGTKFGAF